MFRYDTNPNAICTITSNIITIILAPYSTFQIIPNASKCNTNYYNILGKSTQTPKHKEQTFPEPSFSKNFKHTPTPQKRTTSHSDPPTPTPSKSPSPQS